MRGRPKHLHIRRLADIQDLVIHRGEEAYATFSTMRKLMTESIGRKLFSEKRVLENLLALGSSYVLIYEGSVDD